MAMLLIKHPENKKIAFGDDFLRFLVVMSFYFPLP